MSRALRAGRMGYRGAVVRTGPGHHRADERAAALQHSRNGRERRSVRDAGRGIQSRGDGATRVHPCHAAGIVARQREVHAHALAAVTLTHAVEQERRHGAAAHAFMQAAASASPTRVWSAAESVRSSGIGFAMGRRCPCRSRCRRDRGDHPRSCRTWVRHGQAALAAVGCSRNSLRAEAEHGHAERFGHLDRARRVEDRLRARATATGMREAR